ncbi:unnamed protein product [Trypanosoma congolense IL3000]|uniref:WGS project CAEQ00000000 data, annotated contig 1182 n=1 Tax=Trypanosoma congolense (strain IL3000) TaxID=1068625 RepID=F9W4H4_TRYCI|nr:unnamed protein product [Trypanosoma congolense IL3000]
MSVPLFYPSHEFNLIRQESGVPCSRFLQVFIGFRLPRHKLCRCVSSFPSARNTLPFTKTKQNIYIYMRVKRQERGENTLFALVQAQSTASTPSRFPHFPSPPFPFLRPYIPLILPSHTHVLHLPLFPLHAHTHKKIIDWIFFLFLETRGASTNIRNSHGRPVTSLNLPFHSSFLW